PWDELWRHRPALVAVATRRLRDAEAAEDLVSDVLVQVAAEPSADVDRWGAWLTTVVVRRCHDAHRARRREARAHIRAVPPPPAPYEERVCELDAARRARERLVELPAAQRYALEALIAGDGIDTIAAGLGRTRKSAESLVGRVRSRVRPWLAVLLVGAALGRRRGSA